MKQTSKNKNDNLCEVHYFNMPDGKCTCETVIYIENLKALINNKKLNDHQKKLAIREFNELLLLNDRR